ncbi:MAG TPA: flagellar motor switch protein FliN [Candidatus Baltobacteraceae bacterium]|jgi:flagellar motor switch protein FliN/FliY|nr:flagellar motor switch protein FliN [Candidatus Baltobacteraceae bacterium]
MSGTAQREDPGERNVDLMMNLPVELTAELGSCTLRLSDLLELGNGSVIELNTGVSAPIDLLANGKPIARGEIVAVGDQFGIHITHVLTS